jgi:hypothetical protein
MEETRAALSHQLDERLKFIDPPEPVVGDLLFSWGDIAYLSASDEFHPLYQSALRFGVKNSALVKQRMTATMRRESFRFWFWPVIVVLSIAGAILAFGIARRRKRQAKLPDAIQMLNFAPLSPAVLRANERMKCCNFPIQNY